MLHKQNALLVLVLNEFSCLFVLMEPQVLQSSISDHVLVRMPAGDVNKHDKYISDFPFALTMTPSRTCQGWEIRSTYIYIYYYSSEATSPLRQA